MDNPLNLEIKARCGPEVISLIGGVEEISPGAYWKKDCVYIIMVSPIVVLLYQIKYKT